MLRVVDETGLFWTREKKPPAHRHSKYGWSRSFVTTPPLGKACPTHTILICQILRFDRSLFRQSTERGRAKKNSSKFRLSASVDPRAIDVWFLRLLVVFPTNTGYSEVSRPCFHKHFFYFQPWNNLWTDITSFVYARRRISFYHVYTWDRRKT